MSISIIFFETEGSLAQQAILEEVASENELEVALADVPLGKPIVRMTTKVIFPAHDLRGDSLIFYSLYMKNYVRWDCASGFDYTYMEVRNFGLPALTFEVKWKSARIQHRLKYQEDIFKIKKKRK